MSLSRLNSSILSPLIAFPAIWIGGALLSQLHLLNAQTPWTEVMVALVCVVPLSFIAGSLIGESAALGSFAPVEKRGALGIEITLLRKVLIVLVAIGWLELLFQFAKAGTIPLLSGNIDQARYGQGGPTILLIDLLTIAAVVALTVPRKLFAREHRFELALAAVALGGFALQGGRGTFLLPIVVAILARWLYWGRPSTSILLGGLLLVFVVVVVGFFIRERQHPETAFEAELFSEILPTVPFFLLPLIPIYVAITTNFLALQAVVGHFPTVAPFGHGAFDALGVNYFFTSARDLGAVSASLSPPWITSTVVGPLWADGGFFWAVCGVAVTGILSAGAYAAAKLSRSLRWTMVAALLFYMAVFGFYTSLWTQHVDWLVVAPGLFVLGAVIENPDSPPGITGRVLSRISSRFSSPPPGKKPSAGRRLWLWVGGCVAAIAVLVVVGLGVQATLPEPYPEIATYELPPSAGEAEAVMTNSDINSDNSSLWWVTRSGRDATLHGYLLSYEPPRESETHFDLPASFTDPQYDIAAWSPLRVPALFVMQQRDRYIDILVKSSKTGKTIERYHSPVPRPLPGLHEDLAIATYAGSRPDLYVITRGSERNEARFVITSGESGFRRQMTNTSIPIRGLAPDEWSLDIAPITRSAVDEPFDEKEFPRPDLMLIERNPDHEYSIARMLLGEAGLQYFASQRAIDAPGDLPADVSFLIGSYNGALALYLVNPAEDGKPTLTVYSLQPASGLY